MGNAAFYFYPEPGNTLVTIDLGEALGEMYSDFEWNSQTGVSLGGYQKRVNGMTREIVTIQRDRMRQGETLAHKLMAMQNHLDRGFSVMFTADTSKTWVAPISQPPTGGDTRVFVHSNPFRDIVGTNIPAVDDYVTIETGGPGMLQEIKKLSSVSGLSSTADSYFDSDAVNFNYANRPAFARWYRCYPILKRPQSDVGKAIVTNEHGLLWSLSLRLVPDYHALYKFHPLTGSEFPFDWVTATLPEEMTGTPRPTLDGTFGVQDEFVAEWWQTGPG